MAGRDRVSDRVQHVLEQCPEWSRSGRHRKIISTVDQHLDHLRRQPRLKAALLVWKAQALLALGRAEQAQAAASRSWDLQPTPHACHLSANAEEALGNHDTAEELLHLGWRLFPEAVHLPVQLAIILADQGRVPEAHEVLEQVPLDAKVPPDLNVFLFGMRSNLLAAMGRWAEADDLLEQGLNHHPQSHLLSETKETLRAARARANAEDRLCASWHAELAALQGGAHEVDDAVIRCGAVNELPELVVLAARKLWRAYLERHRARPQIPDVWANALLLAILEIDETRPPIAPFARSAGCKPSSVRAALARIRDFVGGLEQELARRAFAAATNPRLGEAAGPRRKPLQTGTVVPFPGS